MKPATIKIVILCLIIFNSCFNTEKETSIRESTMINQPDKTKVTPILDFPIEQGQNLVFCATVQLAWDKLKMEIGEGVQLSQPVSYLNDLNKISYLDQVGEGDYIAVYGEPETVKAKIIREMQEKFGKTISEEELPSGGSYLLYSYLFKQLPFKESFYSGSMIFKNEKVLSIYGRDYKMNKQVDLVFCSLEDGSEGFEKDNFILRLRPKNVDEEIIVAKMKPEKTLKKTYEKVNRLVQKGEYSVEAYSEAYGEKMEMAFPIQLNSENYFSMPQFNFKISHSFPELTNNHIRQLRKEITEAQQTVRFALDENGVEIESDFTLTDSIPAFELPSLRVDNQFLIYVKQRKAELPYLAIWVDNAAILLREEDL